LCARLVPPWWCNYLAHAPAGGAGGWQSWSLAEYRLIKPSAGMGFRSWSLALRAALVPWSFRRPARIAPACAGLSRHPAARLAGTRSALGCVQLDRNPIPAIGLFRVLVASSQGWAFRLWPLVAAEAVEGTGGRGHQGGAREDKTNRDVRLAGRRRPSLRGNPQGSGYGTRPEYQPMAKSRGSRKTATPFPG
jgi:hypothetical protein